MIDRAALHALTPARRAALIYSEAQSAVSRDLWQAALGSGADRETRADRIERRNPLDALLEQLQRQPDAPSQAPVARPAVLRLMPRPEPFQSAVDPDGAGRGGLTGLGVNERHQRTLEDAAARTGIPAPALAAIVDAEAGKARDGSWQVYSRNPRSSAAGLGQFLSRTWEGLAETGGTWLNAHARGQGWIGDNGQLLASARPALLALRYDAVASINGIADYARRNLDGLRRAGVDSAGEIGATARLAYLGHHLGLGDAIRFLRQGGLSQARARVLLDAQVGQPVSQQRIAAVGDATASHRSWLLGYLDRKVRADRYAAPMQVA
ncbi:peptidoglycan-binding protein [uncultured Sphingomonas sp.]|uniref:peptidoglycan-binding protein n=1 Tax=uncultured Sphingomonas sp. TaxID=158754 RepID=UPI0035CBB332